ncbi:MAG: hypothetical protein JSR19_11370 [Proteobacteria bacterium]|nr:hypothetical protein [Pseudomonadota bacterium]HQR02641.1 hypothetical protein [Rhodocyclaceae bacterium]
MRPVRTACFTLLILMSACTSLAPQGKQNPYWLKTTSPFISITESLLSYHEYVFKLPSTEWSKEYEQVKEAAKRDNSEFQRLRLAIAGAVPLAGMREHARALQQLDQLEREAQKSASPQLPLITSLRAELAERRRLEDTLREEIRRSDDLSQKLDALKAIERSLQDRSGGRSR